MPRAKNAKVWNDDLVTGLRARADQCIQQGSQRQYLWRDGADKIEAVRKDIYVFQSSGKIVGLPNGLTKTVEEEVRAIICGTRPILPEGYIPKTRAELQWLPQGVNPYKNDPYLKRIKYRGGAYAILRALDESPSSAPLSKEDICRAAQPYCDEQMEPNFHAGRSHGAWSSKTTLVKHHLVQEHRSMYGNSGGGPPVRGGAWMYSITENGKKFVQAMLEKFNEQSESSPSSLSQSTSTIVPTRAGAPSTSIVNPYATSSSSSSSARSKTSAQVTPYGSATPAPTDSSKKSKTMLADEQELMEFLKESVSSGIIQKKFTVGAARREHLRTLCDALMSKNPGLVLEHKTEGLGSQLALYITILEQPTSPAARRNLFGGSEQKSSTLTAARASSPVRNNHHRSKGTTAGASVGTPPKRAKTTSTSTNAIQKSSNSARRPLFPPKPKNEWIDSDSSSDDDDLVLLSTKKKKKKKKKNQLKKPPAMSSSTATIPTKSESPPIILLEDSSSSDEDSDIEDRKPAARATSSTKDTVATKAAASATRSKKNVFEIPSSSEEEDDDLLTGSPVFRKTVKLRDDVAKCAKSRAKVVPNKAPDLQSDSDDDDDEIICIDINSQEEVVDLNSPCNLKGEASTNTTTTFVSQSPVASNHHRYRQDNELIVLIDNRERNRNATPRLMRTELTRHFECGPICKVWPSSMPHGDVEEASLNYGDFLFEIRQDGRRKRLPLAVERKRLNDLVGRSVAGDHWKQLQRMRDACDHSILLIEGDSRTTSQFPAYGSENLEYWKPHHYTIDSEELLFRFMGRAILSSSAIKIIQVRDEQGSYRALGALGLVASTYEGWTRESPENAASAKVAVNRLYTMLNERGIPWNLARRVSEEVGSIKQLEKLYESCASNCKESLLMPMIAEVCQEGADDDVESEETARGWSTAIYHAFTTNISEPTKAKAMLEEYKHFVQNQGLLLAQLHQGKEAIAAAQEVANVQTSSGTQGPRRVHATAHKTLVKYLPVAPHGEETFYKITERENSVGATDLPSVVLQTKDGGRLSSKMFLFVMEGKDLVEQVQKQMQSASNDYLLAARSIAKSIKSRCSRHRTMKQVQEDRRVVLLRGLKPALEAAAKRAGFRPEMNIFVDLVLAELMVRYDIVVLQAVYLKSDLESMLKELMLACFHYQLLTRTVSK